MTRRATQAATRESATVPRTAARPLVVTVVDPDGSVKRLVRCKDRSQCLQVIEQEAETAPTWTLLLLTHEERGRVTPLARWAVGPYGLARTPYQRNPDDRMHHMARYATEIAGPIRDLGLVASQVRAAFEVDDETAMEAARRGKLLEVSSGAYEERYGWPQTPVPWDASWLLPMDGGES